MGCRSLSAVRARAPICADIVSTACGSIFGSRHCSFEIYLGSRDGGEFKFQTLICGCLLVDLKLAVASFPGSAKMSM